MPNLFLDPKHILNFRYWPQTDVLKETNFKSPVEHLGSAPYSITAHCLISRSATGIRPTYSGDCEDKLTCWLKAWLRGCLREAEKLRPLIEKAKLTGKELDEIQVVLLLALV